MCSYAEGTHVAPGSGCCQCRTYNGLQRAVCRGCGRLLCGVELPAGVRRCSCGFGFLEEHRSALGTFCPICGVSLPVADTDASLCIVAGRRA